MRELSADSCLCVGWHQASATTAKIVAFQLREYLAKLLSLSRSLVTPKTQRPTKCSSTAAKICTALRNSNLKLGARFYMMGDVESRIAKARLQNSRQLGRRKSRVGLFLVASTSRDTSFRSFIMRGRWVGACTRDMCAAALPSACRGIKTLASPAELRKLATCGKILLYRERNFSGK